MNITILPTVILNEPIKKTINYIDPFFNAFPVDVTSALRTAYGQMQIICDKIKKNGIDKLYPEFNLLYGSAPEVKVDVDKIGNYFWWQRGWSKLLNIGQIVNPPIPAEVLFDYFRPGSMVNGKGRVIDISNHMKGHSFDLAGNDLKGIETRVVEAKLDPLARIQGYLLEPVNQALHVDILPL